MALITLSPWSRELDLSDARHHSKALRDASRDEPSKGHCAKNKREPKNWKKGFGQYSN